MSDEKSVQPYPKLNQDQIRVIQAIYGILISLALRQFVEGIPRYVSWTVNRSSDQWVWYLILLMLICSSTLFLALRFFFIPQEISDEILFYLRHNRKDYSRRWVTLFHYPMVVIQGSLFYALCDRLKVGLDQISKTGETSFAAPSLDDIRFAILLHGILLFANVVWLWRFAWLKARDEETVKLNCEKRWIKLNLAVCVAAVIVFFCSNPLALGFAIAVFAIFMAGSLFDLWLTAEFYVPNE